MGPELQLPGSDGKASLLGQLDELSKAAHCLALRLQRRVSCHSLQKLLEGSALQSYPWSLVAGSWCIL
jgi:hypothetical protein